MGRDAYTKLTVSQIRVGRRRTAQMPVCRTCDSLELIGAPRRRAPTRLFPGGSGRVAAKVPYEVSVVGVRPEG